MESVWKWLLYLILKIDLCKFRLFMHANKLHCGFDLGRSERWGIQPCVWPRSGWTVSDPASGVSPWCFYSKLMLQQKWAAPSPPHVLSSTATLQSPAPGIIVLKNTWPICPGWIRFYSKYIKSHQESWVTYVLYH